MPESFLQTTVGRIRQWAAPPDAGDRPLLAAFASARDEDAFAALVARHGNLVYGTCRRVLRDVHLAEDAFQATFLLLAQKAAMLENHPCPAAWLHATAFRVACKLRSRNGPWAARRDLTGVSHEAPAFDPSAGEFHAVFDEELARLSPALSRPLVLCYLQGATRDEAARALGLPVGTLKHRLESARGELRRRLRRRGVEFAAVGAAVSLTDWPAPAAMAESTVGAAVAFARNGTVPESLAHLLKGAAPVSLRAWHLAAAVVVIFGGMIAGVGLLRPNAAPPAPAKPPAALRDRFNDP